MSAFSQIILSRKRGGDKKGGEENGRRVRAVRTK